MRLALVIVALSLLAILWTAGGDPRAIFFGVLAFGLIGGVVVLAASAGRRGSR